MPAAPNELPPILRHLPPAPDEEALLDGFTTYAAEQGIDDGLGLVARIEDVAMNMLVAGSPQILNQDQRFERMKITARDTGNVMGEDGVADLSEKIDIEQLRAYRNAVGRRTRDIVKNLQPEELKQKVDPSRLEQVMEEGAVVEAASGFFDFCSYWFIE